MTGRRGSTQLSSKKATSALAMLLHGCAPEKLAGFTAAGLAASWNVKPETVERMLAAAREGRLV